MMMVKALLAAFCSPSLKTTTSTSTTRLMMGSSVSTNLKIMYAASINLDYPGTDFFEALAPYHDGEIPLDEDGFDGYGWFEDMIDQFPCLGLDSILGEDHGLAWQARTHCRHYGSESDCETELFLVADLCYERIGFETVQYLDIPHVPSNAKDDEEAESKIRRVLEKTGLSSEHGPGWLFRVEATYR